jgi:hypothetical protein
MSISPLLNFLLYLQDLPKSNRHIGLLRQALHLQKGQE